MALGDVKESVVAISSSAVAGAVSGRDQGGTRSWELWIVLGRTLLDDVNDAAVEGRRAEGSSDSEGLGTGRLP